MSAIYVMWLRQLIRYWRSKSRVIGFLGQPILFLVALGFGFGPIFEQAGGGNYIDFLAPGIVAMTILFNAMFNGMEVIWDRQIGFLKETLVAPVSRTKIMLGRTLGGATVSLVQGFLVFLIALLIGFRPTSFSGFMVALIFMILISILFTALGISIASRLEDMQAFPMIINFAVMPLFFLSGALFPIESAPSILRGIAIVNPLSYGVDGIRGGLVGAYHFGFGIDFIIMTALTVAVIFLGSYMFSKAEA